MNKEGETAKLEMGDPLDGDEERSSHSPCYAPCAILNVLCISLGTCTELPYVEMSGKHCTQVNVEKCQWPGVLFSDCARESTSGHKITWRQAGGEFEMKAEAASLQESWRLELVVSC